MSLPAACGRLAERESHAANKDSSHDELLKHLL